MKTKIIKINPKNPNISKIKEAAEIIKRGGLVAFPTETVYGLGANALDENAVKKIFIAKGRPTDNPLIIHISEVKQIDLLVTKIPGKAKQLIKKFWPGPLTIIMKKSERVPSITTAGLKTLAIRMPENKIALALIEKSGCPIAAPSANISGKPSPTTGQHVIDDLEGKIDAIINAGKTIIGLESTVIDLTKDSPEILRPGKITKKQIKKVIGQMKEPVEKFIKKPKSPGMKYKHYSPQARVIIIKNDKEIKAIRKKYFGKKIKKIKYTGQIKMAKNLFRDFRMADKKGYEIIVVKTIENNGLGQAIMDRVKKASGN